MYIHVHRDFTGLSGYQSGLLDFLANPVRRAKPVTPRVLNLMHRESSDFERAVEYVVGYGALWEGILMVFHNLSVGYFHSGLGNAGAFSLKADQT